MSDRVTRYLECSTDDAWLRSSPATGLDWHPAQEFSTTDLCGLVWGDAATTAGDADWCKRFAENPVAALADLEGGWALAAAFSDGRRLFAGSSGTGAPLDGADPNEPAPDKE